MYAPRMYAEYQRLMGTILEFCGEGSCPYDNSVFTAASYNLGPKTVTVRHRDLPLIKRPLFSAFMSRVQMVFTHSHSQNCAQPELWTIFFMLAHLLQLPILLVFVFDGPKRPKIKRGKMVCSKPHWLTAGMKGLLTVFGFEWYTVSQCCVIHACSQFSLHSRLQAKLRPTLLN